MRGHDDACMGPMTTTTTTTGESSVKRRVVEMNDDVVHVGASESGRTSPVETSGCEREGMPANGRRAKARAMTTDACVFVVAVAIGAWLEVMRPTQRFVPRELMWRYSYPHGENTVPTVMVPVVAFLAPLCFALSAPRRWNPAVRRERAVGGLCASVGLTWIVTCGMKNLVGGIRPDFAARCWPDGDQAWASAGVPRCSGDDDVVQQGRKSFPSGHTSMSFSGFVYCSLYLAAWLRIGREEGRAWWKLCVVLAPTVLALFVGLTRIHDYWHHWEDVVVGALLGTAFACASWMHKRPYARASTSDARANTLENYSPLLADVRD